MKKTAFLLTILFCTSAAFGSADAIISGWQLGEIFFIGPIPSNLAFCAGLYYSSNYGRDITLINSTTIPYDSWGYLLRDADENTIHEIDPADYRHRLSRDGGFSWETLYNGYINGLTYGSGIISGEVYRMEPLAPPEPPGLLERSESYGANYLPCTCQGLPDTMTQMAIAGSACGIDSGEVYVKWGNLGISHLYYSIDYGESFTFLVDITGAYGFGPTCPFINGAVPGEIFARSSWATLVWRIYDFGQNCDLIFELSLPGTNPCAIATTSNPGELYLLRITGSATISKTIHIYHTTDYFETWTEYEHVVDTTTVIEPRLQQHPLHGIELSFGPNPFNPLTVLSYKLQDAGKVNLSVYDVSGRKVAELINGRRKAGLHEVTFDASALASGVYLCRLEYHEVSISKKMVLIK